MLVLQRPKAGSPIRTLDAVLSRFAPLADEPDAMRHIRGTALALALDWMARIPESDARDIALEQLGHAADSACSAIAR